MSCMAACALANQGAVANTLSGIRIFHHTAEWALRQAETLYTSAVCRQCPGIPPCDAVCPVHAHYRHNETGAVLIDNKACIRCGRCVEACPYDACSLSPEFNKIIKCTLCEGRSDGPQCVPVCPSMILKMRQVR
jgi:Fe-S-cluster-containing dehydrogenase component